MDYIKSHRHCFWYEINGVKYTAQTKVYKETGVSPATLTRMRKSDQREKILYRNGKKLHVKVYEMTPEEYREQNPTTLNGK